MFEFQLIRNVPYQADLIELEEKRKVTLKTIHPAFIFVTEDSLNIRYSFLEEKIIKKGQLFLLPRNVTCQIESFTKQQIMMLSVPNMTSLYLLFFQNIPPKEETDLKDILYPLTLCDPLPRVVREIRMYLQENKVTSLLIGLKTLELLYLINRCFTDSYIQSLFAPVLTQEFNFTLFIMTNYTQVKNAEELARLSNYTFSGFDKQFRKVFGMAPYKWMLQKKIDKIYYEIGFTFKQIKVIAEENGFANTSQLGDFCRKHLGFSPTIIRKEGLNKQNRIDG